MIQTIQTSDFFNDPVKRASLGNSLKTAGLGVWDLELFPSPTLTFDDNCKLLLGIEDDSMSYEMAFGRIHSHDKQKVDAEVSRAQSDPENPQFDVYYRIAGINDNVIRTVRSIGTFRFDENGRPAGASGFSIHLSEEHSLKKEIRKLESIVNTSPDFQGISNMSGEIEFINEPGLRLTGLLGKGYKGMRTGEFYDKAFNPNLDEIGKGLKESGIWKGQVNLKNFETGEQIPVYGTYQSVVDETTGLVIGRTVNLRDLRTDIASRREIELTARRFSSLIDDAPVATCVFIGLDLVVEIANEPMLKLWGKDANAIGKPLDEAVPELKGQPFIDLIRQVFITGKAHSGKEDAADLVVDGKLSTFYFNYTYQPLFDPNGNVYGVMDMAIDVTEQVMTRQALEKSQTELLAYFEQSPVAIATISRDNLVFEVANPFYGELVGRKPEEIIGKSLLDALPELKGQGFDQLLRDVADTETPFIAKAVPVELLRGGRLETIYVNLTYQPKRNALQKVEGILVVATEVTEMVNANKELAISETKLRGIIQSAPAGIGLFVGRDLIIENPNQTFIDIVGKGPDIVGLPLREAMPELLSEDQPFLQILDDVYTTGTMFQSDGALVKIVKNGVMTNNYYNITYSPVFDENGKVYAILDIAIDVTEQVAARMKLEETEARLSGAISVAGLATWTYMIKHEEFMYSGRFMEWLGFDKDIAPTQKAYEPLPGEYKSSVPEAIAQSIKTTGSYDNIHPIVNTLTGEMRIIHAQGQVFYDDEGNPEVMHGTAQDITMERELQMELEKQVQERTDELAHAYEELQKTNNSLAEINHQLSESNNELSQYAYVASHDLQEPLRKIRFFSSMLSETSELPEKAAGIVEKIEQSSARMSMLISDLLEFSRAAKKSESLVNTDLNNVLSAVLLDFELLIKEKNAEISVSELPVIFAVPLQMNQLFYNMLSNSLKFSTETRSLKIEIGAREMDPEELHNRSFLALANTPYYEITISDNGIGFDKQYAEQIFEVFKRLHAKSIFPGSGIGLALCRKIVNQHHGEIYAESTPGEGTTFHIIIPGKRS